MFIAWESFRDGIKAIKTFHPVTDRYCYKLFGDFMKLPPESINTLTDNTDVRMYQGLLHWFCQILAQRIFLNCVVSLKMTLLKCWAIEKISKSCCYVSNERKSQYDKNTLYQLCL